MTAFTSDAPTARMRSQRCASKEFRKGIALPSVFGPSTSRNDTFTCLARDTDSIPDHTGAAAGPATPAESVSKQASNAR